jgi:dienelactone hydrolase
MNKFMMLAIAILLPINMLAQNIIGTWSGKLSVGQDEITIVFNFAESAKCTMDSPDQNAKGIPASYSITSLGSLEINIPTIGGSYKGVMMGEKIYGKFSQSGFDADLTLAKGQVERKRPQTPMPPFEYACKEVSFKTADGSGLLAGTITYPTGYESLKTKSVPIVLMVTGSGSQNRDEELFDHKPFLVIADYLAKHGIASLRYDDRGVGKSTGLISNLTTLTNMNDALEGIDYLRSLKEFGYVGILGHSEGGTIAFMAGARGKVDFMVSLAGTGVRGDSVLVEQNRKALILSGTPTQTCNDYCRALKEMLIQKINKEVSGDPETEVSKILAITKANIPDGMRQNLVAMLSMKNAWIDYFISYDPVTDIGKVKCPVMALDGSLDSQVIASTNLKSIKEHLPYSQKNMIKEYPGLNHLFQHCQTGSGMEYNSIEETISPEVLQDIAGWINSLK